jgi:hypothetical protein
LQLLLLVNELFVLLMVAEELGRVGLLPNEDRVLEVRSANMAAAFAETLLSVILVELGHMVLARLRIC